MEEGIGRSIPAIPVEKHKVVRAISEESKGVQSHILYSLRKTGGAIPFVPEAKHRVVSASLEGSIGWSIPSGPGGKRR